MLFLRIKNSRSVGTIFRDLSFFRTNAGYDRNDFFDISNDLD